MRDIFHEDTIILLSRVIFVIDIDGTICDSIPRANKFIKKMGYDGFVDFTEKMLNTFMNEDDIMNDGIVKGAENLEKWIRKFNALPVYLTGRTEKYYDITQKWLKEVYGAENPILIMRNEEEGKLSTEEGKERLFIRRVKNVSSCATFIFFEDHKPTIDRYKKYGLVLKSPDCWEVIKNV